MKVAPVQIKTPARDSAVSLCAGYTQIPLKSKVSWKPGSSKDVYRSKSVAPAWVCIFIPRELACPRRRLTPQLQIHFNKQMGRAFLSFWIVTCMQKHTFLLSLCLRFSRVAFTHPSPCCHCCSGASVVSLEQWVSLFLMLQTLDTVPHVVVIPAITLFYCYFSPVILLLYESQYKYLYFLMVLGNPWERLFGPQRGHDPQFENHWFRQMNT